MPNTVKYFEIWYSNHSKVEVNINYLFRF